MIEGETPEEYQRRLKREAAAQRGTPGTYEYNKPYQEKYRRSEKGKATESAYNKTPDRKAALNERSRAFYGSEAGQEARERRNAKRRANWAALGRQSEQPPKEWVPEQHPKESGSPPPSPHDLEREPFRPQGSPSELDRAARNREMIERMRREEAKGSPQQVAQRGKKKPHMWWRKLW